MPGRSPHAENFAPHKQPVQIRLGVGEKRRDTDVETGLIQTVNLQSTTGDLISHRIAFLHSHLPAGGSTIFLLNLAGELIRRGATIHVFSMSEEHPLAADFERRKIPVSVGKSKGLIFEDKVQSALRELARFTPNVVVANMNFRAGEVLRHLPPGVVRVGVIHAVSQIELAAVYANTLSSLVVVSHFVRDLLAQRLEFQHLKVQCIELGIPIPDTLQRESVLSNRALRILYLGRLEEAAKRVRLFPAILDQLKAARIPFIWTIAGEGPEREFLQSWMVTETADQKVCFTGLVAYVDVPALLANNDILLLTSDTEVFPLSLQEGMASGLVPVTSDLPGRVREIVTPDAGILVAPSNTSGYADAIVWLHQHREAMQAMSVKARTVIGQDYSVAAMAVRWLAFLTAEKPVAANWPDRWKYLPPLFAPQDRRFSGPIRGLRRWAARIMEFVRGNRTA